MQDFTIVPEAGKKGRSFSAKLVSAIVADSLWGSGSGETIRPVWAQFVGSDAELRPFATNLRLGRKAQPADRHKPSACERLEFLKGAGYQHAWQREPEGTILTVFHPDLFRLDPGMVDPEGASFVMLVPAWWVAAQSLPPSAAAASLFAAYLDRRTRCPLVADVAFYEQLYAAALEAGLARVPSDRSIKYSRGPLAAEGLEEGGIVAVVAFSASHEELETFLAEQVATFFGKVEAA